jgi:uncharacterized membrane protein YagU involved in acid resistance
MPLRDRYPVVTGVAYGLLVWTVSYLGWIPPAGLMPPATRQPRARRDMMIVAHVVWSAALGLAANGLAAGRRHTGMATIRAQVFGPTT